MELGIDQLISFHESLLTNGGPYMCVSTITLEESTVKALKELKQIKERKQ